MPRKITAAGRKKRAAAGIRGYAGSRCAKGARQNKSGRCVNPALTKWTSAVRRARAKLGARAGALTSHPPSLLYKEAKKLYKA